MNFAKRALLIIIAPLFPLLLFTTAIDVGVVKTVGNPSNVKGILSDSGVYNDVIPNILNQAKTVTGPDGSVPLTNPAIQSAAKAVFTPAYLQQTANNSIDGIYHWLDGKTVLPDFTINLASLKDQFADSVAQAAQDQASSLPACTRVVNPANYDVFSATCLPAGVTPVAVATQARNNIVNGSGFLDKTTITANDIKSSGSNQSIFTDKLKQAPKNYRNAKKTPIILVLLTLLAATGIVLLSSSRRRGFRHIGITLTIIGLLMLVFSWSLNYAVSQKLIPKINFSNSALQDDTKKVITDVAQAIDKNFWFFGGAYTTLGIAAIGSAMFINRGSKRPVLAKETAAETDSPEPKETESMDTPTITAPQPKPSEHKSQSRRIKVQ